MPIFSFEKSIGAVVFNLSGDAPHFLLLQYRGGHWGFVKGHIEKNETDEETLRREAREEANLIDLEILPKFSTSEVYYYQAKEEEAQKRKLANRGTRIFKKVAYYLAKTNQIEIKFSHEHKNFVWLPYDEAFARTTNANSKKVLEKANSFLMTYLPNAKNQVE